MHINNGRHEEAEAATVDGEDDLHLADLVEADAAEAVAIAARRKQSSNLLNVILPRIRRLLWRISSCKTLLPLEMLPP